MRGQHFAAELKNWLKSIVGSPTTELGIGKLRSTVLTSRRSQRHSLALARGAVKGLTHVNGVLLEPQRGAFGKSVRRKLKKVVFFVDRKHFFRRSVCQSGARIGHRQKKRGGKSWKCRVISFTTGRAKKKGKMNSFTGICAVWSQPKDLQQQKTGSAGHAFSCSRKQNHHFLDQKPGVLRSGGNPHVLGLPTIIIIKKY